MIKLIQPLTQIDTAANLTVGTRTVTKEGNEYIYLRGVASTLAYSPVTYNSNGTTTLLATTGAIGLVAVAQAATVADKWGWYQIKGSGTVLGSGVSAANVALYSSGTAGYVKATVVSGDLIAGMFSGMTASTGDGGLICSMNYPFATDTLS